MKNSVLFGSLMAILFSLNTHANVKLESYQCPIEFEGVVDKVEDVDNQDHALAKVKVTFKNERGVRNSDFQLKSVNLLKHGMIRVAKGELYSVELRGDKVCDIRAI